MTEEERLTTDHAHELYDHARQVASVRKLRASISACGGDPGKKTGGRLRTAGAKATLDAIVRLMPPAGSELRTGEYKAHADAAFRRLSRLIREVFGNPFRPVVADPSWLTPTVVALADAIYAERAFEGDADPC